MSMLLLIHPICRKIWNAAFPLRTTQTKFRSSVQKQGDAYSEQRISFDFAFALLYLAFLHGFSGFKVLTILYLNYQLATKLPRKYVPAVTWVSNVAILFANELSRGYPYRNVAGLIMPPTVSGGAVQDSFLMQWGSWMDSYGGLVVRWEVLFNLTILRLISFNLDYYWSIDKGTSNALEVATYPLLPLTSPYPGASEHRHADVHKKRQLDPANLSERERVSIPAEAKEFCFRNYVAYAIYAPLYLTGPIITFNDYISQSRFRPSTIETSRTIRYGIRFVLVLLAMEITLHFDYVGAISMSNPKWDSYTAAQLSLLSYFNLHIIWLKLLLPWRFFRLWSLVDGIDPPENMIRCVSNNYSALSFWRSWHRSFYRWTIRYLYGPLGGASFRTLRDAGRSILNYALVFTFIALWHDLQLRLLIWGWLIVLFFMPEVLASSLFPKRKWEDRPTAYRMLCGVGSVANVLMMMAANLVGFAVGVDGLKSIISSIAHDWSGKPYYPPPTMHHRWLFSQAPFANESILGATFFVGACITLFVGVQVMFEIRESEHRKDINLKC
jgi:D-alanyl-lipoteichoic acid acyltransferase DltB (MBOAT superfamily)